MVKRLFQLILLMLSSGSGLVKSTIVLLLIAYLPISIYSQVEMVPFRARFMHKGKAIDKSLGGRLEGVGSFTTDFNGEISMVVPKQSSVRVFLSESDWKIIYPESGIVPIPGDSNTFAEIVVEPLNESGNHADLLKKLENLKKSSRTGEQEIIAEIRALRDSLSNSLGAQTLAFIEQQMEIYGQIRRENEVRDSLEQASEQRMLAFGRQEMKSILTSAIDHYITRTQDLRDEFKLNGFKAFNNGWVTESLDEKISAYNDAYEELNKNKNKILDLAELYWKGAENYRKVDRTRQLLEYALDEVHKMTTLSSNNLLNDVRNYRDPRVKRKNKRKKKEIQSDMDRFVYDLSNRLTTLIDRKSEVFQLLDEG